ncbi:hypothetical protein WDU94_014442, partial [Cyamophila willieti]
VHIHIDNVICAIPLIVDCWYSQSSIYVFSFLSYCTWKFFASLFSILLVLCVGEVWVDRIWPEIAVESPTTDDWLPVNDRSLSAAEISQKMSLVKENLDRYWKWLINLRRDKPSIFCLSTSCILFSLILITWSISGLTLVYLSLLGFLCGPALAKRASRSKLVQEYLVNISQIISSYVAESKEDDEKIIPHVTEETKKFLDVDTVDAAPLDSMETLHHLSDLGVSSMPSYDEVCLDSLNGETGDEFALHQGEPAELSDATGLDSNLYTPPLSSVSNTSSSASLVSDAATAFDNDDQEPEYSSTPTSPPGLHFSHLISNMSKSLGFPGSVGDGAGSSQGQLRKRRNPSSADDDSEFEMIEHEDVS